MSALALSTVKGHPNTVRLGKRVIGFMCRFTLRGVDGWRFIARGEDVADRMPAPPAVYATPEEALAGVSAVLTVAG